MNIRAGKSPPDRADLYISLSRAADLLDESVAEINRWRNDPAHGFPRKYNFDAAAKDGRPAIKRGPYFRFDEIQQWKKRAGDLGNCERPPDERTAAPADTGHGGKDRRYTQNANQNADEKQAAHSRCDGENVRVVGP